MYCGVISRPGQYDHDVETNRRPEYHHSFGGKPTLKETVRIKCTNGVPEQVCHCVFCMTIDHCNLVSIL
jgi:hypothetical protein